MESERINLSYEEIVKMIESVIQKEMDLDPEKNKINNLGEDISMWGFKRGSATVYVMLTKGISTNYIQVFSPLIKISNQNENPMYLKLLLLNSTPELCSSAFAVKDSNVILKSDRTTGDLSPHEILEMIIRVGRLADKYDDKLLEEFGGEFFK